MNRVSLCALVVFGLAAALLPSFGCGGGGGGGGGGATGAPQLMALPILWIDVDSSTTVNGGDQLIFRFDRPAAHGGGDPAVEIAIVGPGVIAAGSTWANGPTGTQLTATLAAGSALTPGIQGVVSLLNMGPNTIVNPGDPGAGNAVPAGAPNSIMVNFSLSPAAVGSGASRAVISHFLFDGDLQWEILVGKTGTNRVFQSAAFGIYAPGVVPTGDPGLDTRSIAIGNVDGDADIDFVTGNFNGPNYVYLNDGAGNFTHVAAFPASLNEIGSGATNFVWLADWDNNGTPDLFVANTGSNYIYFNDGGGLFDGPAPGSLPLVLDRFTLFGGAADTRAAFVGDWDNSLTSLDIITVDDPGGGGAAVIMQHIVTPNAPGTLPTVVSTAFPAGALASPRSCTATDYNGDGIPDLLVGYDGGGGMQLWTQFPIGTWTLTATIPGGNVYALSAAFDLNGDLFPDVVQGRANGQPDQVFLNTGVGPFFLNSGLNLGGASTFALAFLNADNLFGVDFVTASNTPNALWLTGQ